MADFDPSEMFARLDKAEQAVIDVAIRALDQAGEQVIGDAAQLAPVGGPPYSPNDPAPGTLQSSGTTKPARFDGGRISKTIGFNTNYAAVQHERLDFRHSHGEAKFLEKAMNHDRDKVMRFVADAIKDKLER